MQRFISAILATIMLVISCLPCSDIEAAPAPYGTTSSFNSLTAGSDHRDDHHVADLCSPLCSCSCCAAVVLPQATTVVMEPLLIRTDRSFVDQLPQALSDAFCPIWQPPQLA